MTRVTQQTPRQARTWPASAVYLLCAVYVHTMVSLAVWTIVPGAAGLAPTVIVSDSMRPGISAGDVVLTRGAAEHRLRAGQVVTFDDPARPGRLLTHRIVGRDAEGRYRTRGDANATDDSTLVSPDRVRGVGRLLVPAVGLPLTWTRSGAWHAVVAWTAGTLMAVTYLRMPRALSGVGSRPASWTTALTEPPPPVRPRPSGRARLSRPRIRAATAGFMALLALVGLASPHVAASHAAFTGQTVNDGNTVAAAADWVPPVVTASAVATITGYTGALRPGDSYYVYASADDSGGPPSGVSSVTADMSAVTGGATQVPLQAGNYTLDGVTYGWRSGALVVDGGLTTGSYAYTHTSIDAAGNTSGTQSGFSVDVDADSPTGIDVQAENASARTAGAAETGDTLTFTFSEPMAPASIQPGWDGTATTVVVRIMRSGSTTLTIRTADNSALVALGSVATGNHVSNNTTTDFTGSTMVMSAATVTITLGTPSGAVTTASPTQMSWIPDAAATDVDGFSILTSTVLESGANDRDF